MIHLNEFTIVKVNFCRSADNMNVERETDDKVKTNSVNYGTQMLNNHFIKCLAFELVV